MIRMRFLISVACRVRRQTGHRPRREKIVLQQRYQIAPRFSARWSVVAIVAATFVPALALLGWLAIWLTQSEKAQLEQSAQNQAREVVAAVDREIVSTQHLLTSIAGSPLLHAGRIRDYYDQAAALTQKIGLNVVLRDLESDRQVFNTAFPWGKLLEGAQPAPRTVADMDVLRAGKPYVSDVFFPQRVNQRIVAVVMPVFLNGKLRYTIASGVPLTRFAEILQTLNIPQDQLVTVIDRKGIIVTRSDRHNEFAGTQIKTSLPISVQHVGRSVNREGLPFHWFNRRSDVTDWYVSVGIADSVFDAPARRAGLSFALAGSLLLAAAIMLSYRWGGRLAQSAGALGIDRKPTREEFEVLFDAAPNGVLVVGDDGTIVLANKLIEAQFGYSNAELTGQPVDLLVPAPLRDAHVAHRASFAANPLPRPMGADQDLYGRRKDGSKFPVEIALNPISTGAGKLTMASVIDISARKLSQRRLSAALVERDDLRRRYMQAQEAERLRLAHELHDQTGQTLTAAMLELKGIEHLVQGRGRDRLRSLRKQMENIGETLHRVAWELRPLSIDEVGLAGALNNYLSEWSARYKIEVDFLCRDSHLDELPDEVRTTIYRVVQEALNNVAKHARQASEISVVIERASSSLRVTIDDDGCGFDVAALKGEGSNGLGIAGMRERLFLVGGEIEIESAVNAGTTIFARIPLRRDDSAA
jgi:PAS domain S-box-containing protein